MARRKTTPSIAISKTEMNRLRAQTTTVAALLDRLVKNGRSKPPIRRVGDTFCVVRERRDGSVELEELPLDPAIFYAPVGTDQREPQ